MRKLLIIAIVALVVLGGAVLVLKDRPVSPLNFLHDFKLVGEWLDVNFLTFGASEKQAKHLVFVQRRLDEFINIAGDTRVFHTGSDYDKGLEYAKTLDKPLVDLNQAYRTELARAYYMAEQLALLDHEYIPTIEAVYRVSFRNLETLAGTGGLQAYRELFKSSAQEYNRNAIKTLLQKHQHTQADTLRYKSLVELWLKMAEARKSLLSPDQLQILNKAKIILSQGREIEWAYDLLSGIQ